MARNKKYASRHVGHSAIARACARVKGKKLDLNGIAVCGAILNGRTNFHFDAIAYHLNPANGPMQRLLAGLAQRYAAMPGTLDDGNVAALKQLWRLAYREAATLAYADAFRAIMLAFIVATLLVPLLRQVAPLKAPSPSPDAH